MPANDETKSSIQSKIERILQGLGVVWSLIAFLAAGIFFLGGEWAQWRGVKEMHADGHEAYLTAADLDDHLAPYAMKRDLNGLVRKGEVDFNALLRDGDSVTVKSFEGYLYSQNSKGRDELDVQISSSPMNWTLAKDN